MRPFRDRNRIRFYGHRGYVRLALRFGVPIAALLNVFLGAFYRARRGKEAPLSASASGEVHAATLPRLSEEISEAAEEGPIEDKPVPHTAGER